MNQETLSKKVPRFIADLLPWAAFAALMIWGWRVDNLFTNLPGGYRDQLEVLWGIRWYFDSLLVNHTSPLFYPLIFSPYGWHTATLAHTPFTFTLTLPLYALGGATFAYNILALVSYPIAFAGSMRLARLYTSPFAAAVAALVFTFMDARWARASYGHLHTLWVTSLLPWLVWALVRLNQSERRADVWKFIGLSGLAWGLMINFSLYGSFLGALGFLIWGKRLLRWQSVKRALAILALTLVIASPTLVLFILGSRADVTNTPSLAATQVWSASLNSLFIPSVYHPLAPLRALAQAIYRGPLDESGYINLGLFTLVLGIAGAIILASHKRPAGLVILAVVGIILAFGLALKWDGQQVSTPLFGFVNQAIWDIGRIFRPALFLTPSPNPTFSQAVPLPGFVLSAIIPYWSSARVMSRYAFAGGLALFILGAIALEHSPRWARYLLAALWIVEMLPTPTGNLPAPTQPHPAYAWLAQQALTPGQAVVDFFGPLYALSPTILYATTYHHHPTVSGTGSFAPVQGIFLWLYFRDHPRAFASAEGAAILGAYHVQYLMMHMSNDGAAGAWEMVRANPAFAPIRCFDPLPDPSPWPYPICVAELRT